jgi:hypothetical protein
VAVFPILEPATKVQALVEVLNSHKSDNNSGDAETKIALQKCKKIPATERPSYRKLYIYIYIYIHIWKFWAK